jgi:dolichyl-phosphate-mannose-protein mannosyltransferase
VGCSLHSHDKQLPKWGWEQMEVTCNPSSRDPNNLWNVEGNLNDRLPKNSIDFYRPSFLDAVIEAHKIMTQVRNMENSLFMQFCYTNINVKGK